MVTLEYYKLGLIDDDRFVIVFVRWTF